MSDTELKGIADKWFDSLREWQRSLLFSKYPLTYGISVLEHIALMYLFENEPEPEPLVTHF